MPLPSAPHHILVFTDPGVTAYDFQAPVERRRLGRRVVCAAERPIELRRELAFEEVLAAASG